MSSLLQFWSSSSWLSTTGNVLIVTLYSFLQNINSFFRCIFKTCFTSLLFINPPKVTWKSAVYLKNSQLPSWCSCTWYSSFASCYLQTTTLLKSHKIVSNLVLTNWHVSNLALTNLHVSNLVLTNSYVSNMLWQTGTWVLLLCQTGTWVVLLWQTGMFVILLSQTRTWLILRWQTAVIDHDKVTRE